MDGPLPKIGVAAVIWNQYDKVLLVKRGKEPAKNLWSIPGGTLEPGETMVQGCRREVLEETGLDVQIGAIIAVVERITEDFHYVIIDFLASISPNSSTRQPVASSDVDDAKWVLQSELRNYQMVDGLMEVIVAAKDSTDKKLRLGFFDRLGNESDFLPFRLL